MLEKNVAFRDGCSMWNNICIVFRKIIYSSSRSSGGTFAKRLYDCVQSRSIGKVVDGRTFGELLWRVRPLKACMISV